jgi:cyclophilin family peptidyl-prolyl cis-trans isomerase
MRRILFAVIAIVALSTLVACKSSTSTSAKKTATPKQTSAGHTPAATSPATSAATTPQGGTPMSFSQACQKTGAKTWTSAPAQIIDTSKTYTATIKTDKGDIVLQLFSDTPISTNNFVFLACKGFYDGLTFHRVIADFVIQGGDPQGTGLGGPGYTIPGEPDGKQKMDKGVISFAKSSDPTTQKTLPDSAGSQFFVTIGLGSGGSLAYLDPDFTVFGKVTSGQDIAGQIQQGDKMNTVTIEEK